MSSPETIVNSRRSGAIRQDSRNSEPTTSTRPQRRSRKRIRHNSRSPRPYEKSDTENTDIEATRPERNISSRPPRLARKRSHIGSSSPTRTEETDTLDRNTEGTRPERNISTTSVRPQRSRKRIHRSGSPTANEESDTGDASTEATRPGRNMFRMANEDDQPTERATPNTPLLSNIENHPSAYAREGQNVSTKNLNFRGAWPTAVELYRQSHNTYKDLFRAAGFDKFLKIDALHIPQAYALALTERWFSETNTVHLPSFEIGPTPVDWTMITGLHFGGRCIKVDPKYNRSKAQKLLGARKGEITGSKIKLSVIKPTLKEVKADPEDDKTKALIFRRLFLYIVGSCFFSNNRSVINRGLVKYVERIDNVGIYDWGQITYAAFLAGMRRKVTAESGAFTGFWPFLVLWAFEYLDISRPQLVPEKDFPRALRWKCPQSHPRPLNLAEVFSFRCRLDYIKRDQMTLQPYLGSAKFRSGTINYEIDLAKKRVPFKSLDTWEYYLGERCRQQLGFPRLVPLPPPENMHGTDAVKPEDAIGVGRSAETLVMDKTVDYHQWFSENSIGKLVDINELLGGPEITRAVVEDWLAKYLPDMKLVPRSEADIIAAPEAAAPAADTAVPAPEAADTAVPARDAATAHCSQNQEIGRARGHS